MDWQLAKSAADWIEVEDRIPDMSKVEIRHLIAHCERIVPKVPIQNGVEVGERFMTPQELKALAVVAELLLRGEVKARLDPEFGARSKKADLDDLVLIRLPPPRRDDEGQETEAGSEDASNPSDLVDRDASADHSQEDLDADESHAPAEGLAPIAEFLAPILPGLEAMAAAPEVSKGDREFSRRTHAGLALGLLNNLRFIKGIYQGQGKDAEERAWLEAMMADVAKVAFEAGRHAELADRKVIEDMAVRGRKNHDASKAGGAEKRRLRRENTDLQHDEAYFRDWIIAHMQDDERHTVTASIEHFKSARHDALRTNGWNSKTTETLRQLFYRLGRSSAAKTSAAAETV